MVSRAVAPDALLVAVFVVAILVGAGVLDKVILFTLVGPTSLAGYLYWLRDR